MDRHQEGGAQDRQPPQEVQLYQQLNNSTPFEAALAYATRGWPVLPLHSVQNNRCTCSAPECHSPGKHPHTVNGAKDATTDLEQTKQWWTCWPDANIGIATGDASGLVVVDVDPRNDGKESLERLQEAHEPFDTYTVSSGGGGWHFYFKHPGGHIPCRTNLEAGVDAKADGGLVVAAPSLHLSGVRYWVEPYEPVAEMPHWLQARLSESCNGAEPLFTTGITLEELRVSARIKTLLAQGDQAREYPSRSEALFAAIRAMVMAGHSDDEISGVVLNSAHALSAKAREKGLAWLQGEIARARTKAHVNGQPPSSRSALRQALPHPPLRLFTVAEIKTLPSPSWLIESLLPQGALCFMYGPSGDGKSFLALEWALSIGSGVEASLGHAITHGPVVYVAAEGVTGIKQCLIAREKARGRQVSNVLFLAQPVNLLDEKTANTIIMAIDQALLEHKLPAKPALIVFDTFARCFVDGDENLAKDASRTVATLDELRMKTGACVLVVHHSGKGDSRIERGSSALRGAAETMILVERRYGTIEVKIDKQKDAEPAEPDFLKLVSCGESCTLEAASAKQSALKNEGLNEKARTLLLALSAAETPLSHKELRLASQLRGTTFYRALKELAEMGAMVKGSGRSGKYGITDLGNSLLLL